MLNGYTIAFAALLVPAGKLADRLGHKRVFLLGIALFTLGSAACAVAPTVAVLNGFRVIQAVGAAAVIPASLALVMRAFPRDRLPVAVAIWGAMGAAAGAVGPTLGAVIVDTVGWRWVFLINVPIGIGVIVAGLRVLRESSDPDAKIPALVGAVLIALVAALASYAVVQTTDWGWVDPRTLGTLAVAAALLIGFVAHQQRTDAPVLDLELLSIPNYRWANVATFAFGIAFTAMFLGSLLFLEEAWGYSTLRAGLGVTPGPLLVAILAPAVREAGRPDRPAPAARGRRPRLRRRRPLAGVRARATPPPTCGTSSRRWSSPASPSPWSCRSWPARWPRRSRPSAAASAAAPTRPSASSAAPSAWRSPSPSSPSRPSAPTSSTTSTRSGWSSSSAASSPAPPPSASAAAPPTPTAAEPAAPVVAIAD